MSIGDVQTKLLQELENQIREFRSRRKFYRTGAFRFVVIYAALSSLVTVLIGVNEMFSFKIIAIIALVLSGATSVLSAWEGYFNFKTRWIQTNETLMNLYELKNDINFEVTLNGSLSEEKIRGYYLRYSNILKEANKQWQEQRSMDSN